MKVGLYDADSHNFPNLCLAKISAWHKRQGDQVEFVFPFDGYDVIYISKVFTGSPEPRFPFRCEKIIRGGTGYDLRNRLPDEVERITPDYSLYKQFTEAYGFLTRGCPRQCPFCIVSEKEGTVSRQVGELAEFHRGQNEIMLLDPNILACKDREKLLIQLSETNASIDFTQGLDIRFVTNDITDILQKIKIKQIHFAWDNPKQDLTKAFKLFKERTNIDERKLGVYVLTNYNSTIEEDLYRIYTLRELGYSPYVMIYDKENAPKTIRNLQRWCNNRRIYRTCTDFYKYTEVMRKEKCEGQIEFTEVMRKEKCEGQIEFTEEGKRENA